MNTPRFVTPTVLSLCTAAFVALAPASQAASNEALLTAAIVQAGNHSNRDVVVLDLNKVILADTVTQNIGSKYPHDKGNEISQTLADGKTRTFIEKSVDYPKGVKETAYAVKNAKGKIIGAVIISTAPLR